MVSDQHVTAYVTRDSHVTSGVTNRVTNATPSRPVPTRPVPTYLTNAGCPTVSGLFQQFSKTASKKSPVGMRASICLLGEAKKHNEEGAR